MNPEKQDEYSKIPPDDVLIAKLRDLQEMREVINGNADGVTFMDRTGMLRAELGESDFVLLTRERFMELASGRLLDVARGPDRRTMRALAAELHGLRDVAEEQTHVLTVDLGGETLRDMAAKLAPDPLGPVKLGRKERRAEDRRRRRRGGR